MQPLASAACVALAGVFGWAALAKLAHRRAATASFAGLGVPSAAAAVNVAIVAEAFVALALVLRPRAGAWAALGLVCAFTLVVVLAIHRGAQVGCACFGAASDRAVSSLEVVRNGGVAALAVVATGVGRGGLDLELPALVIVSVVIALGRVGLAMSELRHAGGHLLATPLPGEPRR